MQDYIIRATAAEGRVLAFAARTTLMVKEAKRLHTLSPVASAALGRTLTVAAMLSKSLKGVKDTLTIQIKGDGPLGGIVVVSDSKANVRGYVNNNNVYLPLNEKGKLDVKTAVGENGYINVIKDFGLKEPYIGFVNIVSGEIAEDIAYYFSYSEQIPSVVSLGVQVDKDEEVINAGGFFIQLMPGADDKLISQIENKIENIPSITKLLEEGNTPEDILKLIFENDNLNISEKSDCFFKCNCSRERMERNVISLGENEVLSIFKEQPEIEVECHFCNKKYIFLEKEFLEIFES